MELKHTIDSIRVERDQVVNESAELRTSLLKNEKELVRLRQDAKLNSVGLNDSE